MICVVSQTGAGNYLASRLPMAVVSKVPKAGVVNFYVGGPGLIHFDGINSSPAANNFMTSPDVNKKMREIMEFSNERPRTHIYAFFNGKRFSNWLEISFTNRFMNRDVGPVVGVTLGVGYMANQQPSDALPGLGTVAGVLQDMEYRGEVMLSITESFEICNMQLCHLPAFFAMYAEILRGSLDGVIKFLCEEPGVELEMFPSVVAGTLVTIPPFPGSLQQAAGKILAPASAEKHLWRWLVGGAEPTWVTTHGQSLQQARSRMNQTLLNIAKTEPTVQYRTDLGIGVNLVFSPGSLDGRKPDEVPAAQTPDPQKT